MNQEDRLEHIGRGQQARIVHAEVSDRIAFKEATIINRLVSTYRAGKLTHEQTLAGIASIAEMRSLLGDLETEIKQGIEASEIEHAQAERYS